MAIMVINLDVIMIMCMESNLTLESQQQMPYTMLGYPKERGVYDDR